MLDHVEQVAAREVPAVGLDLLVGVGELPELLHSSSGDVGHRASGDGYGCAVFPADGWGYTSPFAVCQPSSSCSSPSGAGTCWLGASSSDSSESVQAPVAPTRARARSTADTGRRKDILDIPPKLSLRAQRPQSSRLWRILTLANRARERGPEVADAEEPVLEVADHSCCDGSPERAPPVRRGVGVVEGLVPVDLRGALTPRGRRTAHPSRRVCSRGSCRSGRPERRPRSRSSIHHPPRW